jgi:hypothetical protein
MKYRIYIDETGNADLRSSSNLNHRFLSLTGVVLSLDYVREVLHPELETIKNEIFHQHPDDPIIFHRKEIVNRKHPFERLRLPEVLEEFNKTILAKLTEWQYTIITVLIDKKELLDRYTVWRYDPYHYCLAVMIERYLFFLEEKKVLGDVMIESRGGKEDLRLKNSFSRLFETGTDYVSGDRFQNCLTSKELKVKPKSANIPGLQLADIIAHPSRRQFLIHLGHQKREHVVFGDEIIDVITDKYYQKNDEVYGVGMKKLP